MSNYFTLITGGGSGLGYELAKLFAVDKHNLLLVGRQEEDLLKAQKELCEKYQILVEIISADLSSRQNIPKIFSLAQDNGWKIDVLVNNAGFGLLGAFTDLPIEKQLNMIDLDVSALVYLTHLFLAQAPEKAKILNVASLAAFQPGPFMGVYYASKAFVLSFSEALAEELKGRKISVTALCPGPIATGFWKASGSQKISKKSWPSAAKVARAGYWGMKNKRRIVIPGLAGKLLAAANRFSPRRLVVKIVSRMNRRF